jgi:hypothetical protein
MQCTTKQPIKANAPTGMQLYIHALTCAVPMVGFGFMDNLVMIQVILAATLFPLILPSKQADSSTLFATVQNKSTTLSRLAI